jgi:hypothetical protein
MCAHGLADVGREEPAAIISGEGACGVAAQEGRPSEGREDAGGRIDRKTRKTLTIEAAGIEGRAVTAELARQRMGVRSGEVGASHCRGGGRGGHVEAVGPAVKCHVDGVDKTRGDDERRAGGVNG